MSKLGGLAAIGLAYLIVATGVVHFQGVAYREGLRAEREVARKDREATGGEARSNALAVNTPVTPKPELVPEPEPVATPRTSAKAKTKTRPRPRAAESPSPQPSAATNPRDMKVDSLSDFPILGLGNLSPEDEKVLGKFLHDWIVTVHGEDDPRRSGPQKRELEEAVRPLLETRARKDLPITITILDSDQVNAFSHIGGYIYLTRGLLGIARGNADYLFVVGGELAHLDLKHAEKTVAETTPAGSLRHLYHQIAEGYSEARVFEADDWVVGRMVKLDQTQLDCLSFLRKLANYAAENGFAEGNVRPKTGLNDGKQDIDNQIRADPAATRRVTRISERFFRTTASAPSPASATPPR